MEDLRPIYIFCEGTRTEPLYFEGFKRRIEEGHPVYTDMVNIVPCGRSGGSLLRQARRFVKSRELDSGRLWLVFDKDDFPASDFDAAIKRIGELDSEARAAGEGSRGAGLSWNAAWSNQCFEFWLMLHFAYYTSDSSRAEYMRFLSRELEKRRLGSYEKNREDLFDIMLEHGNPLLAMRYAEKLERENLGRKPSDAAPSTKVHHLVRELAAYLPENEKRNFV